MEESYSKRLEREEREKKFQKKMRLEHARRAYLEFINDPKPFNLGVKYNMIDQLSEELAQYLDMVDCRRVLTEMLEFVYDPSTRPEDPVDYFAKLTKDRKKDKRELNKARRHLYQLMWKEYEIKDEIAKLRTLLAHTNPREFKPDGTEKTVEEIAEYDNRLPRRDIDYDLIKSESLRSLMGHKDEKIPGVFGTHSIPAPEPTAVSVKDIMNDRAAALEKKKSKKKGSKSQRGSGIGRKKSKKGSKVSKRSTGSKRSKKSDRSRASGRSKTSARSKKSILSGRSKKSVQSKRSRRSKTPVQSRSPRSKTSVQSRSPRSKKSKLSLK